MNDDSLTCDPWNEIFDLYPPSRQGLFDNICSHVSEGMLWEIAKSDYGYQADEHFAALSRIQRGLDLDKQMGWFPGETLALFRCHIEPGEKSLRDTEQFHIARAFCAAALIRIPNPDGIDFNISLKPLIESCLVLGGSYRLKLAGLLTYLLQQDSAEGYSTADAFALLVSIDAGAMRPLIAWFKNLNEEELPWHTAKLRREPYPHHPPKPENLWRHLAYIASRRVYSEIDLREYFEEIAWNNYRS